MTFSILMRAGVTIALAAGLAACNKPAEQMGPAQKAGAAIDNAGTQVADKLHENLDKADQAARQMTESAKATGREIESATTDAANDAARGVDRATENVGKKVEQAGEKIQESARK